MIPIIGLIIAIYCVVRLLWTIIKTKMIEGGRPYAAPAPMIHGTYAAIGAIIILAFWMTLKSCSI